MVTEMMVPAACTNCGQETTSAWENKKRTVLLCQACVDKVLRGQAERAARAKVAQTADPLVAEDPIRTVGDSPASKRAKP